MSIPVSCEAPLASGGNAGPRRFQMRGIAPVFQVHWRHVKFVSIPVKMAKFNVALLLRLFDSITSIFLAGFYMDSRLTGSGNGPFLCRITF